jgi:hypothetical protein
MFLKTGLLPQSERVRLETTSTQSGFMAALEKHYVHSCHLNSLLIFRLRIVRVGIDTFKQATELACAKTCWTKGTTVYYYWCRQARPLVSRIKAKTMHLHL